MEEKEVSRSMSSGLMSCVRENSPPLELDMSASTGPLSLPEVNTSGTNMATSTPVKETTHSTNTTGNSSAEVTKAEPSNATPNAEQQKRRRFNPLRNLRRIFRRRTITSAADTTAATTAAATASAAPGSSNTLPPPASSSSEKNLRSAGLSTTISSSAVATSASSPSSPLTHQQLQDSYQTQSLPKSKSYGSHRDELISVILGKKKRSKNEKNEIQKQGAQHQQQPGQVDLLPEVIHANSEMYSVTSTATSSSYHQRFHQQVQQAQSRQSIGIGVFPGTMNRSYITERTQNLRSVGDSSQELDSSGTESGVGISHHAANSKDGHHLMKASSSNATVEMSDSQRSLSEGRLVDSDFTRDPLSQSHDSVFSESATASNISIVLQAELVDALRKRRNRPDASDEDLGLPRSPASPQRRGMGPTAGTRNPVGILASKVIPSTPPNTTAGEVSSLSLLSMNSTDGEESGIHEERRFNSAFSMSTSDILLRSHHHEQSDEVDRVSSERHRLSHAAAKHKMAIRPVKKNVQSRQHRRTLDPSIPEASEDTPRVDGSGQQAKKGYENDVKNKTRSLPPFGKPLEDLPADVPTGNTINKKPSKTMEQTMTSSGISSSSNSSTTTKKETVTIKETTTSTSHQAFGGLRALTTKATALFDNRESSTDDGIPEPNDSGFLRRLMHRNSKRSIAKISGVEEGDAMQSEPKKLQISTSCMDTTNREALLLPNKSRSATSYEQNIEETRKLIKREINNEGKTGLNAMLNSFNLTSTTTSPQKPEQPPQTSKPKSGPAARQRYLPQELSSPGSTLERKNSRDNFNGEEVISVTNLLSKSSRGNDTFQSTSMVREITAAQQSSSTSRSKMDSHFEKNTKIVGLTAFQQKLTRSNESVGRNSNSSNSLETSTDEPSPLYYAEKQRKTVEKSRSFRNYQDERDSINSNSTGGVHNNMPSLPDLSLSFRVPVSYYNDFMVKKDQLKSPTSPTEKCVSLGFEINDNKLIKSTYTPRAESTGQLKQEKNVIMTTSNNQKSTPANLGSMMTAISPRNSANISEIEENIDLIVKSPFVSVLRKTTNAGEEQELSSSNSSLKSPTKVLVTEPKLEQKPMQQQKERPKVLDLKQQTSNKDNMRLSERPKTSPAKPSTKSISTTAINMMNSNKIIIKTEPERKSAPVAITTATEKTQNLKSSRHSLGDSCSSDASDSGCGSANGSQLPEFMKIQLNRVNQGRLNQTHNIVLAKNVKTTERQASLEVKPTERSCSIDNLSSRRASHDSTEYEEESKAGMTRNRQPRNPQRQSSCKQEVIGQQIRAVSANSIRTSVSSIESNGSIEVLSAPKSPVKSPALPKSPMKQCKTPMGSPTKLLESAVTLRTSTEVEPNNNISLEERKRLFLNAKNERKVEELRMERKKSICEELFRKPEVKDLPTPTPTTTTPTKVTTSPVETANTVVLRKKSFAVGTQQQQHTHSFNGNSVNASSGTNNQEGVSELMKVFARRSLKIKDEHEPIIPTVTTTNAAANPVKKLANNPNQPNQSVDSDKENQSASEEKLDKLNKSNIIEVVSQNNNNNNSSNNKLSHSSNRNSLADFRNSSGNSGSAALSHAHGNNNNNNNNTNTNVNNSNNSMTSGVGAVQVGNNCTKPNLPPIKISNLRHVYNVSNNNNNNQETSRIAANNHNNNNNTNGNISSINQTKVISTERFSLQLKKESTSTTSTPTVVPATAATVVSTEPVDNDTTPAVNNIERSATVHEFKGIHQRRAEWEQRAKEAFK